MLKRAVPYLFVVALIASATPVAPQTNPSPAPTALPMTTFHVSAARTVSIAVGPVSAVAHLKVQEPQVTVNTPSLRQQKLLAENAQLGRTDAKLMDTPVTAPKSVGPLIPSRGQRDAHSMQLLTASAAPPPGATQPPRVAPPAVASPQFRLRADFVFNGNIESVVPADTQISVGSKAVLQVDNGNVSVWRKDRQGTPMRDPFNLKDTSANNQTPNGIFNLTTEKGRFFKDNADPVVCDPWVVYDVAHHRWIVTALAYDDRNGDSVILIAVSNPDEPATWSVRSLDEAAGVLHDQPKIGLTSDKIVLTWEDFAYDDTLPNRYRPLGGAYAVLGLIDLENGADPSGIAELTPDPCHPVPAPVRAMSAGSAAFIIATVPPDLPQCRGGGITAGAPHTGNDLWVVRVDGPPNVAARNTFDVKVTDYSAPADVKQRNSNKKIFAGDTRVVSALWQNDRLWAAANTSCLLSTRQRDCFTLWELATDGPTITVKTDRAVASSDRDLLFPALAITDAGDLFAVVSQVSEQRYLGAAVFARLTHHDDWQLLTFGDGTAETRCPIEAESARVGDYSGADRDPDVPAKVWVAAQLATSVRPIVAGQVDTDTCYQQLRIGRFVIR